MGKLIYMACTVAYMQNKGINLPNKQCEPKKTVNGVLYIIVKD